MAIKLRPLGMCTRFGQERLKKQTCTCIYAMDSKELIMIILVLGYSLRLCSGVIVTDKQELRLNDGIEFN